MNFDDIKPITPSIIMVVGVGGGGGNAVNHMYSQGVADVSFMVCNTDSQALNKSPIPNKVQMGEGLGAGNDPEKGRLAAENSIDTIKEIFAANDTKMVFVTAGMGGGTGTGAAPVIAKAAKEMGILTVAIVTIPFESEGKPRIQQAVEGIAQMSKCVDSLIVINNAHIVDIYGDLPVSKAFAKADDILCTAARSISDIIIKPHKVNVDFADVKKVMTDSGVAIMGSAVASGENRAIDALSEAMSSPLLHHKSIEGAQQVLVSISTCEGEDEIKMSETGKITEYVQHAANNEYKTNIIWGVGYDDTLESGAIRATVVATGFEVQNIPAIQAYYKKTIGRDMPQNFGVADRGSVDTPSRPNGREVVDFNGDDIVVKKPEPKEDLGDFQVVDHHLTNPTPSPETIETVEPKPLVANVEPAAVESGASSWDEPVITKDESGAMWNGKRIYEMSEEELEGVPAWRRREMELDAAVPAGTKKEKIKFPEDETPGDTYQTQNLFS